MPISPGWSELTYLNKFLDKKRNKRDYLLMWIIATLNQQHGQALEIVIGAKNRFNDPIFEEMRLETMKYAKIRFFRNKIGYVISLIKSKVFNLIK